MTLPNIKIEYKGQNRNKITLAKEEIRIKMRDEDRGRETEILAIITGIIKNYYPIEKTLRGGFRFDDEYIILSTKRGRSGEWDGKYITINLKRHEPTNDSNV
jgi:hypothetical protein